MNDEARTNIGTPSPTPGSSDSADLRDQIEQTRDELGRTVEALAAKADLKARAKEKTTAVKDEAAEKATLLSGQIREKAEQAARAVKDHTPTPLLTKSAQAAAHVREGAAEAGRYAAEHAPEPLVDRTRRTIPAVRANRAPLLVVGAAALVILLVRRSRGRRR
ncbi:DUF3618 domain-containing protein [Streptomyces sp. NPDC089795]|uniref:DUF3618 domain-containing protein n=1 Tax=Streptomyces sp. NPDC089795 TaxID=3155297 RepID=UPI0034225180